MQPKGVSEAFGIFLMISNGNGRAQPFVISLSMIFASASCFLMQICDFLWKNENQYRLILLL
jgi:hypothetical protein